MTFMDKQETDCCNIHRGRSLCLEFKPNSILAHSTPKRGRPYHQTNWVGGCKTYNQAASSC